MSSAQPNLFGSDDNDDAASGERRPEGVDAILHARVLATIKAARAAGLSADEEAVLALLITHWGGRPLRQDQIADAERWMGAHPVHEQHRAPSRQSTLRKVRGVINSLRVARSVPVLSVAAGLKSGYYLPLTFDDAEGFLVQREAQSRAQARSHMVTYNAVAKSLGLRSVYFEALRVADETPAPDRPAAAGDDATLDDATEP